MWQVGSALPLCSDYSRLVTVWCSQSRMVVYNSVVFNDQLLLVRQLVLLISANLLQLHQLLCLGWLLRLLLIRILCMSCSCSGANCCSRSYSCSCSCFCSCSCSCSCSCCCC